MKSPTIEDIASRTGVSRSTVSRVLSGSPRVSEAARAAVAKAVKDLGYKPNLVARSLATGVVPTIQVLIADIRNPVYAEMARGIQDVARVHGYTVDFENTDDSPDRELEYLAVAGGQRFAGVMVLSAAGGKELRKALESLRCPVVLLNRRIPGFKADAVLLNNERGGYMATRCLMEMGHRRICHLAGPRRSSASRGRLEGFRRAVRLGGLDLPRGATEFGDLRMESGERFGHRLCDAGLPFSAVFAANDLMAVGILAAFAERGVSVPKDVSVIGFDDMAFSRLPGLWLTTVRQPQYEMGRAAASLIVERMRDTSQAQRTVVFEPTLVERRTCAPPCEGRPALVSE